MNKLKRIKVYELIDSEREYQDKLWNENTTASNGKHSVPAWLLYMQDYLTEASHIVSRNSEPHASKKASNIIRKITAMGVSCMEQHGADYRY